MGAAFVRVDVVGERIDNFGVAVVPLKRDFRVDAVFLAAHVDRLLVHGRLRFVQMLDERDDAAFVVELMILAVALVVERDGDTAVEERELSQPLGQRVEAEDKCFENAGVRLESHLGAAPLRGAGDFQDAGRIAALVGLVIDLPVAPDLEVERFRQRVYNGHAHAVQASRDLVAVVVELAPGVKDGEDHFGGGLAAHVLIDRNAATVVGDCDRSVNVNRDVDFVAESGQRLVDRVVDDFVDEVMQPRRSRRADVHRRPFPDGFEALEYLDFVGAVIAAAVGRRRLGILNGVGAFHQTRIGMITYV